MPDRVPSNPDSPRQKGAIDRRKVSVMHVFRDAHANGDGRKAPHGQGVDEAGMDRRALERRTGIDDAVLRRQLSDDLADLLTTIRLDAAVDLTGSDYVGRSVVNYGFRDLGSISASELNTSRIAESIRNTLIAHEPRLIPETIQVHLEPGDRTQRLSFSISAEMASDPVDIPVDFVAEVDIGAGKVDMARLGTPA